MNQSGLALVKKAKVAEKYLFYLIVFCIPLNLGKHFILESSYIYGKLVDYVIPTIYIQDILVLILIILALPRLFSSFRNIGRYYEFGFLVLFLGASFLSICSSGYSLAGWYYFGRLFLYILFGFYVFSQVNFLELMPALVKVFSVLLLAQSLLGLAQWQNQGSVFNNYLFFGEQPYSLSTPGIMRVSLGGVTRLPPYGTFRHPNVLAAFLVFCILYIFALRPKKLRWYLPVFPGIACLILTFSRIGLVGLGLGVLLLVVKKSKGAQLWKGVLIACVLVAFLFPLLEVFNSSLEIPLLGEEGLSLVHNLVEDPSFFRRANLMRIGAHIFMRFPLFGIGLNNFMYYVDLVSVVLSLPKFTQPIHNVYMLLLVETGFFGLFFFLGFVFLFARKLLKSVVNPVSGRYPRALLVLLFLLGFFGLFDHYLLTSHQMLLLVWLTFGLALQYNLN